MLVPLRGTSSSILLNGAVSMVLWMEEAARVVTDNCNKINNSTVITIPLAPPSGVGDDDVRATLLLIRKYIYIFLRECIE